jgi:hypothetical protein
MAAGPVYYKTTFPPIDLEENVQTKLLVAQSPQEIRYITYPATSFSKLMLTLQLFHLPHKL